MSQPRFWWRQAADQCDPNAMFALGLLLEADGEHPEAEQWLLAAARLDHVPAQAQLAYLRYQREADDDAVYWWQRAAEHGHLGAMYNLGVHAANTGDTVTAETWWHCAAGHDHLDSMAALAQLLDRHAATRAVPWWKRAALAGHPNAIQKVAELRQQKPWLLDSLPAVAEAWKCLAGHGYPDAMFNLAMYYQHEHDPHQADMWLLKAVRHSDNAALHYLATLRHDVLRYPEYHARPPCAHVKRLRRQDLNATFPSPDTIALAEEMVTCRIECGINSPYRTGPGGPGEDVSRKNRCQPGNPRLAPGTPTRPTRCRTP